MITFLFDCVNRDREKGYALVTLGLMMHTVGDEFEKHGYLAQLISVLLNQLNSTKDISASKYASFYLFETLTLMLRCHVACICSTLQKATRWSVDCGPTDDWAHC